MSGRPDYLVIIPPHGVFSAHWTEHDAFKMVDKLKSNNANNCKCCGEEPFVVEVPQTEGICSPWRLEKTEIERALSQTGEAA